MSGLLFLSSDDFYVAQGQKGSILCSSMKGFSVVLFYSTQCVHCQTLIPIFKSLPNTIAGFQFGMINVSTNKNVVMLSKQTIAPITYVPYIVFFVDGKPFMKYSGPYEMSEIKRFIIEVANNLKSKQKFYEETQKKQVAEKKIPAYTIGHPKCDDDVCYLEFEEAYQGKK